MGKLINFQQYQKNAKKNVKKDEPQFFGRRDYKPAPNCRNSDSYGIICVKCGKCGRKFD